MRKLATIRQVSAFLPIPEADRIQIALVEGWRCVCKKEEFQVDEWVVYCEIDSFLPIRPEFEHLRKTSYKKVGDKEGFRLKTVKMRGQISQGLLLPLSVLDGKVNDENHTWNIGDDVTEILGITKWEDEQLSGHAMGPFPEGVPKTEAERIQNQTKEYQNLRTLTFHVTEKLDGSSCTMFWDGKRAGICSRNLEQLAGSDSPQRKWWDKHPEISQKLEALGKNYAVQGELVGHKIARNTYKFNDMRLFVFSVFDRDEMAYLDPQGVQSVADALGLDTVPLVDNATQLPETMEEAIAMGDGKSLLNPKVDREGLVWVHGTAIDRVSIKSISNKYLVKET